MADSAEDIDDIIDELLAQPKQQSADGVSETNHDLAQVEAIRNRRKEEAAAASGGCGVRFFNTKPPGTV